jgi:hypothetical protein
MIFFAPENEFGRCDGKERSEKMNFVCHYRRQMSGNTIIDKSLRASLSPGNEKKDF